MGKERQTNWKEGTQYKQWGSSNEAYDRDVQEIGMVKRIHSCSVRAQDKTATAVGIRAAWQQIIQSA
jgi:hypothetical protein